MCGCVLEDHKYDLEQLKYNNERKFFLVLTLFLELKIDLVWFYFHIL
jgi:hypothetical protein